MIALDALRPLAWALLLGTAWVMTPVIAQMQMAKVGGRAP